MPDLANVTLDFAFGKLADVARAKRPTRRREYSLLLLVLIGTSIPYAVAIAWRPALACYLIGTAAVLRLLVTFITSWQTDTAHHVRFLLAGSNPFGMTGASSQLLAAVDAMLDWREDRGERQRRPVRFLLLTMTKFAMTPLGPVFMVGEFLWDTLLLRRHPRLARLKWQEFFALAWYHDLICPEKSNDLFYADLAFARYQNDVVLYQWHRLRALVFELQHEWLDALQKVGEPETNLFWQDDFAAYATLARLQVESLEASVAACYAQDPNRFPIPGKLGAKLIHNARPLAHYHQFRDRLLDAGSERPHAPAYQRAWEALYVHRAIRADRAKNRPVRDLSWHVLRLLHDGGEAFEVHQLPYLGPDELERLTDAGVLNASPQGVDRFTWNADFLAAWRDLLDSFFEPVRGQQVAVVYRQPIPRLVCWGDVYRPLLSER